MLDISRLKNRITLDKLKLYDGPNEYIHRLRIDALKGKVNLTPNQIRYIENNYDKEVIEINKIIEITPFFGEELKNKWELSFTPERLLVETLLVDDEKFYHVKGKLTRKQKKSELYFIPKSQVNTDIYSEDINESDLDIDFDKYTELNILGRTLFDHQKQGVKFLIPRDKCILADDMGLGKTTTAIVAALETGVERILIVCPANAKINWKREIMNYGVPEEDISIIKSGHWNPKKFTIINYDILKNFHTLIDGRKKYNDYDIIRHLVNYEFELIICDEAHMLKNPSASRSKVVLEVSENIKRRWLLTGTPIANRPMDYYNLLLLCDCPLTSNWRTFAMRYCAGRLIKKRLGGGKYRQIWLTNGASNLDELHNRTRKYILRRKKEDHLNLPPKIVSPYYLELDDMEAYNKAFEEYLEWARSEGKKLGSGRHMVELIVLRKFIAMKKTEHTIELVEQAIEQGRKIIIFTNFTDTFNVLMKHFGKLAVGHNGKMNDKQKQISVDRFQSEDEVKVFVGNLLSAGTAITLTKADFVIMNDLDYVPSNHAQAEDRAWRIGSEKVVNVYYPIFEDTIDVMMYEMLQRKKEIINTVIGDTQEVVDISRDMVSQLSLSKF